jgi:magnesium chelatase family protein
MIMIGLPDAAVKESRDRMESALRESGTPMPRKQVVVNLAPADVRKEGSLYDVPMAISILAADGILPADKLEQYMMVGELSLDGTIKSVKGCLPMAIKAREMGLKGIIVPRENATEAAVVNKLEVLVADKLREVIAFFKGTGDLDHVVSDTRALFQQAEHTFPADFADVKGQEDVKRAFTVAAAGGHNLIMIGPPGAGKTLMAKCLPSILPPITLAEALETTKIHSVAGMRAKSGLVTQRPFRAPHHKISGVALIGGGVNPMPGEVSLAHNGVLYLDELPEFQREALEVLRQPLEDRQICIARARQTVTYPASMMLVASMNPCPCGYYNHPTHPCTWSPTQVRRYLGRISGPLLDRIDLQVSIQPLSFDAMSRSGTGVPSAVIREQVTKARELQVARYADYPGVHCNAQMTPALLRRFAALDEQSLTLLRGAMSSLDLSARAYDRILKVARTVADLAGSEQIAPEHIAEAISYRQLDRAAWGE